MKKLSMMMLLGVAACSGGSKAQQEDKKAEDDSGIVRTVLNDKGPEFSVETETLPSDDLGTLNVVATHITKIGGHTYVKAIGESLGKFSRHRGSIVVDAGDIRGLATLANDGTLLVRFLGKQTPKNFAVSFATQSQFPPFVGLRAEVKVDCSAKTSKDDLAESLFYLGLADQFGRSQSWRARSAFHGFATTRLQEMAKKAQPKKQSRRPETPRRWSDMGQLVGLYSGATSIRETLQHDRALWVRTQNEKQTIAIKDVARLELKEHDWATMLKTLGKKPVIEPMAKFIPVDMAYMHFHDLRTFVKLVGELDNWVSPLAQQFEGTIGARHFVSYYEKQLMLARSGLAEKLGHEAAHSVAVVVGDPFLREGTDVSMIFRVKSRSLLTAALAAFELSHTIDRKDVKRESSKHLGVKIDRTYTPDLLINQYRAEYDGLLVVSNSRGALTHLIDASKTKNITTLDQSGDFQYMRAVQPFGLEAEDGFVFISDAFVIRSVSPEVRILNARRLTAEADLLGVNNAMMLSTLLEGEMPDSVKSAIKVSALVKEEGKHSDGSTIQFTSRRGAFSKWGSARMLRPLREMTIDNVTAGEAQAYKRFADNYQSYWTNYFDPIGVQMRRTEDGKALSFDVRVLPLIANSEYDQLIRTVGKATTTLRPIDDGLTFTMAIGPDAEVRRMAEFGSSATLGTDIKFGWLGDWVQFGFADHSAFWDLAIVTHALRNSKSEHYKSSQVYDVLSRTPIFVAAHVANQLAVAGLLAKLKQHVTDAAPGAVVWGPKGEKYRDVQIVSVSTQERETQSFSIYYAIVKNVLVVSIDETFLKMQIDRFSEPQVEKREIQSAIQVSLKPTSWLAKTAASVFESSTVETHVSAMGQFALLHSVFGNKVDAREHGLNFLGYEPRSPIDGTFSVDQEGLVRHSSTGTIDQLKIESVPLDTAVTQTLERLASALGTISFVGDKNVPGLHATLEWAFE